MLLNGKSQAGKLCKQMFIDVELSQEGQELRKPDVQYSTARDKLYIFMSSQNFTLQNGEKIKT